MVFFFSIKFDIYQEMEVPRLHCDHNAAESWHEPISESLTVNYILI